MLPLSRVQKGFRLRALAELERPLLPGRHAPAELPGAHHPLPRMQRARKLTRSAEVAGRHQAPRQRNPLYRIGRGRPPSVLARRGQPARSKPGCRPWCSASCNACRSILMRHADHLVAPICCGVPTAIHLRHRKPRRPVSHENPADHAHCRCGAVCRRLPAHGQTRAP